jgi:hypothetical protein
MGPDFALLRFATPDSQVWYKAVGEPNLREFQLAIQMARCDFPHIPRMIAQDDKRHAWLMEGAKGEELGEGTSEREWLAAGRCLAQLQICSRAQTKVLLDLGCLDLRAAALRSGIEDYLSRVDRLMQRQTSTRAPRLTFQDLREMEKTLCSAVGEIEGSSVGDTIGHSDMNGANVLVTQDRATFLDWAQAHVGCPLITFHFLERLRQRTQPCASADVDRLRQSYLAAWTVDGERQALRRLLPLVPLVAAYSYALVCGTGADDREPDAQLEGYRRALARQIHREVKTLESDRTHSIGILQ